MRTIECEGKLYRVENFDTRNIYGIEIYEVDDNGVAKNWFPIWSQRYSTYNNMVRDYNDIVENLWEYVN